MAHAQFHLCTTNICVFCKRCKLVCRDSSSSKKDVARITREETTLPNTHTKKYSKINKANRRDQF